MTIITNITIKTYKLKKNTNCSVFLLLQVIVYIARIIDNNHTNIETHQIRNEIDIEIEIDIDIEKGQLLKTYFNRVKSN
jgi:hypothetical protein